MEKKYRVVDKDHNEVMRGPELGWPDGAKTWRSLVETCDNLMPDWAPHSLEGCDTDVWVDVPEPEPLPPELDTPVWGRYYNPGEVVITAVDPSHYGGPPKRLFRGRVVDWEEIT